MTATAGFRPPPHGKVSRGTWTARFMTGDPPLSKGNLRDKLESVTASHRISHVDGQPDRRTDRRPKGVLQVLSDSS